MLILRGIHGSFPGGQYWKDGKEHYVPNGESHDYPKGALDEPSALKYASLKGYDGLVLDVSGETGETSSQTLRALDAIHNDSSITALYGFSGGGYNVRHILDKLTPTERARIKLVVVLGAPGNPSSMYDASLYKGGNWEVVYKTDPPPKLYYHMDGPRYLLQHPN